MTFRALVTEKLGRMMSVLSHPLRLRIVEELANAERDVASLQKALGISHSGVSQHLSQLRSLTIVTERRDGRRVFYRLVQPELAAWVTDGLRFIEPGDDTRELRVAVRHARALWNTASALERASKAPKRTRLSRPTKTHARPKPSTRGGA